MAAGFGEDEEAKWRLIARRDQVYEELAELEDGPMRLSQNQEWEQVLVRCALLMSLSLIAWCLCPCPAFVHD